MNELIDSGDPRAKVVGKRRPPAPGSASLAAAGRIMAFSNYACPRKCRIRHGIYRFKTHEEADEWMMDLQVKRR